MTKIIDKRTKPEGEIKYPKNSQSIKKQGKKKRKDHTNKKREERLLYTLKIPNIPNSSRSRTKKEQDHSNKKRGGGNKNPKNFEFINKHKELEPLVNYHLTTQRIYIQYNIIIYSLSVNKDILFGKIFSNR
eukprot:TRINITY_DN7361_c1_g1_i3.p2 TRINITY_DN7361_c1_g1~~TRINITY_DN7361_c1_g1_i3.p2  ORF type:complete len:131 (+),score=7.08 TRINITY_DN7361_c1_g1_i3:455-847(+)